MDARRAVTFSFRVSGAAPRARRRAGPCQRRHPGEDVEPRPGAGRRDERSWNGRLGSAAAKPGRYSFRLTASETNGATLRSAQLEDESRDAFDLYDNMFPIRGRHRFGSGTRALRRRAHRAQPPGPGRLRTLRHAARRRPRRPREVQAVPRGGRPLPRDRRGRDERGLRVHAPAPRPRPSRPAIACTPASASGRSATRATPSGCHLHFELWHGPGWYDGGKPFDPLPSLKSWDAWS